MDEARAPYAVDPAPDYASRLEQSLIAHLEHDVNDIERKEPPVMLDLATPRESSRRDRRPFVVAAVAACLAAVALAGILLARREDRAQQNAAPQPFQVTFNLTWPDLQGLEQPRCLPTEETYESASNGHCFRSFDGLVTVSGDMAGTALWTMAGNLGKAATASDSAVDIPAAFNGTYIVQATIPGCGTGEFMIAEQLRFDGWENGAFNGTWQVIPASGRGELANISGGGLVPGDRPEQSSTQELRTGQLTCPPQAPST